ncbi:hypothetical protein ACLOJK_025655 [Asimina triloba]
MKSEEDDRNQNAAESKSSSIEKEIISEEEMAFFESALAAAAAAYSSSAMPPAAAAAFSSATAATVSLRRGDARNLKRAAASFRPRRMLTACSGRGECREIEDCGGGGGKRVSRRAASLLQRFRHRKGLYVTDITDSVRVCRPCLLSAASWIVAPTSLLLMLAVYHF